MFITLSKPAEADLYSILTWFDTKKPGLDDEFMDEVEHYYRFITEYPYGCQELEEGVRRVVLRRFTYQILYVPRTSDIFIVAVLSGHISPAYIAERIRNF